MRNLDSRDLESFKVNQGGACEAWETPDDGERGVASSVARAVSSGPTAREGALSFKLRCTTLIDLPSSLAFFP